LDELFEMLTSPFSQNKSGSPKLSDKLPTCILSRKPRSKLRALQMTKAFHYSQIAISGSKLAF